MQRQAGHQSIVACRARLVATIALLLSLGEWPAMTTADEVLHTPASNDASASKKGLQVEMLDDALALGVKHAAINVNLAQLVAPNADPADASFVSRTIDGQTFCFHRALVEQMSHTIKALSDRGAAVYLIILVYESSDLDVNRVMLHPDYDRGAPNRLSAFNTRTDEGRAWLSAVIEMLAERWSRPDELHGRVAGYILGNEVNSHWWWSNMGRATFDEFAADYLSALGVVHGAVRRHSESARIYVSLDHHWTMQMPGSDNRQAFAGKDIIDYLASHDGRDSAKIDWHVAYHPYPENLFDPRFWRDATALPEDTAPRITFKNLEVLTDYLRRPELLVRGEPRRVILSEQGFHTPDGPEGEAIQAAAYCYAYRKVDNLDGIDAFILHRHVDHPHEFGLRLGLRRFAPSEGDPRPRKLIYDCFRRADEPDWEDAFQFALPIIGIRSWAEAE